MKLGMFLFVALGLVLTAPAFADEIDVDELEDRPVYTKCLARNFLGVTFYASGHASNQLEEDQIQEKALEKCRYASRRPNTCRPIGCTYKPF